MPGISTRPRRRCARPHARTTCRAIQALAEFYALGSAAEPDLREAAYWYEKAAERGDAQAQFFTGRFYATGTGVPPSIRQAAKWFERAAESGHATAAHNIAVFYLNGNGVTRDVATAIKWFERASEGGISAAGVQLGRLYSAGNGVPRDQVRAAEWLSKAAKGGDAEAKTAYALFLIQDQPSEERLAHARSLLTDAAEIGHPAAAFQLGGLHMGRSGGAVDFPAAAQVVQARGECRPCRGPA